MGPRIPLPRRTRLAFFLGSADSALYRTAWGAQGASMKIVFLVRSMGVGGAQRQLCVLCRELMARGNEVVVLLYYGGEPFEAQLRELGVRIVDLEKRQRWRNFTFFRRLVRTVRAEQPRMCMRFCRHLT